MKHAAMKRTAVALVTALMSLAAIAYDEPAGNLGFTSFLDGAPPAGPGWYYTQYLQFYSTDEMPDLPFPGDPQLDAWVALFQVVYQSDQALWGTARWGLDVILPYAAFDLEADGTPLTAQDGFGDLLVGPFIQWDPLMCAEGPVFMNRIELQVILPTGEYDEQYAINPGSDVVSLDPYWSATWFASPKWTISWRIHYLWNEEKDDYTLPDLESTQAGEAIHANFASAYEVVDKTLRVGLNGYYFEQIDESKRNGQSLDGGKEKVLAVGPGLLWSISQDNYLFANIYFEMDSENRPEGDRYNVRFVHHF